MTVETDKSVIFCRVPGCGEPFTTGHGRLVHEAKEHGGMVNELFGRRGETVRFETTAERDIYVHECRLALKKIEMDKNQFNKHIEEIIIKEEPKVEPEPEPEPEIEVVEPVVEEEPEPEPEVEIEIEEEVEEEQVEDEEEEIMPETKPVVKPAVKPVVKTAPPVVKTVAPVVKAKPKPEPEKKEQSMDEWLDSDDW